MPKHRDGVGSLGLKALSIGAVISAIAGGYKFGEVLVHLKKLHDIGPENAVFERLIERVRIDLAETDRLLYLPNIKFALSRSPDKVQWIRSTVVHMRETIEEMIQYTERVRKDLDRGGPVGIRNRLWWVLDEYEKLVHRRMELAMSHQGLTSVLNFLAPLEPLACCESSRGFGTPDAGYERETDIADRQFERPRRILQERDEGYYDDEVDRSRMNPTGRREENERSERTVYRREYVSADGNNTYRRKRGDGDGGADDDMEDGGPLPPIRTHWPTSRL